TLNKASGFVIVGTFAAGDIVHHLATEIIDDVVREQATSIKSFIDHNTLLVGLSKVIATEIAIALFERVREINVGQAPIAELRNCPPVIFNPGEPSQFVLGAHRRYGHVTRTAAVRVWANFNEDALVRSFFEKAVDLISALEVPTAHRQQVISD